MRQPSILDLVRAVTEVAPAHPEVAVWWYTRAAEPGAPPMVVVLEGREGARPDAARIGAELAERLGPGGAAVRLHGGAGETHALYRLLTAPAGAETGALRGGLG